MQNEDMKRKITACTAVLDSAKAEEKDKVTARLHRAYAYRRESRFGLALIDVDQVLKASPSWGHAHYERGVLMLQREDFFDAVRSLNFAIPLMRDKAFVWFARGEANFALEYDWAAIQDFSEAFRLSPEMAEALDFRGRALCRQSRPEDALADWKISRSIDPAAAKRQRAWMKAAPSVDGTESNDQFMATLMTFADQGCPSQ